MAFDYKLKKFGEAEDLVKFVNEKEIPLKNYKIASQGKTLILVY